MKMPGLLHPGLVRLLLPLALVTGKPGFALDGDNPLLENSSWQLVEIRGLNDSTYTPRNPENYLLRFRLDSRLEIEADCNQAGATWSLQGDSLTVTDLVTTRKFCQSPSLFNRYIMHLDNVQQMQLGNERLILKTGSAGAELEFEPYVFVPGF